MILTEASVASQGCYLFVRSRQKENAYGAFCGEILRAEGLMGFEVVDLDTQPMPSLGAGDLAVVSRCFLTVAESKRLFEAVEGGSGIAVIQPRPRLLERCGLTTAGQVLHPGSVRPRAGSPGAGAPLQTHLPIPLVALPEDDSPWQVLADAVDSDWQETGFPAAITRRLGRGRLALFFYDLPAAVALIRFGDPALASYTTLEWRWPHAGDLYAQHIDPRLAHLPQADLHAQFLAQVLASISPAPLARLWYYEEAEQRSACVFQSDGDGSTLEQFEALATALEERGATGTFYLMAKTKLSPDQVAELRRRGHMFGPHVDPLARGEELYFAIPAALAEETEVFRKRFGEVSPTLQCHCAPWVGYLELVPIHQQVGFRLLFAHLSLPHELWGRYMCGSGRPLKFCGPDGIVHNCWQQPVVTFDDASVVELLGERTAAAREQFEALLAEALGSSHTTIPFLSHPVSFHTYSRGFMEPSWDRLREEGVPMYNADQWLDFIDRRAAIRIAAAQNHGGNAEYTVSGVDGRFALMVPMDDGPAPRLAVNGRPVDGVVQRRLERNWLFVPLAGDEGAVAIVEITQEEG